MSEPDKVLTVFSDDDGPGVADRVRFVLGEMGIKMSVTEQSDDFTVYVLTHAEPLDKDGKKEKP